MLSDDAYNLQRRTVVLIILTVGGQLAGLTMIGTFATCTLRLLFPGFVLI